MKKLNSRQRQAAEMREKIQKASFRLFDQYGFENVTMDEIAKEAGCSVGNIYHYFPNKDSLTVVMTDQVDQQYLELKERYASVEMTAAERLIDFSGEALVIDSREELLYQCFVHSIKYPEQGVLKPDFGKVYFSLLEELVLDFYRSSAIRKDFSPEDIVESFIIMNRGILIEWRIEEGRFDIRARGRRMADALIRGFCEEQIC